MPDTVEDPVHDAELAVFERKSLALDAAAAGGLPGAFQSFRLGGLRASIATANRYGFLNTVEGLNEHSVEHLPEVLTRFANRHQITIIATSPSQTLNDRMLDQGYELAPRASHCRPACGSNPPGRHGPEPVADTRSLFRPGCSTLRGPTRRWVRGNGQRAIADPNGTRPSDGSSIHRFS